MYIARNLPSTDTSGGSDVFITLRCCGKTMNSQIKYRTLNPNWYETLAIDVNFEKLENKDGVPAGFSVIIYDSD